MKFKIVILFLFLIPSTLFAEDTCFRETLPFFQNFDRLTASAEERHDMLTNACLEILQMPAMNDPKSIGGSMLDTFGKYAGLGLIFGGAISAFSVLQSSEKQKAYKAELEKIKKIPNPMDRIRKVYELVSRTQGVYDNNSLGANTLKSGYILGAHNAANLIDASETGTIGVCREMAALLQWSLMQVSRHSESKSMALGPNDFSSEEMSGQVPGAKGWDDGGGHVWVRISIPQYEGQRLKGFNSFDLDTTWYSEKFSPLLPRRAGITVENIQKLKLQCSSVNECLTRKIFQEKVSLMRSSTNPPPSKTPGAR